MQDGIAEVAPVALAPVAQGERIQALDVVRGFALLGIFLMNVEWFTRPMADLGRGIDPSSRGTDYLVSWLVYVFVQGKFWTLFSLLFGMGFAVMLERAERAGRGFSSPYLRRLGMLFLFGCLHAVLVWSGDILHNYAIAALGLLLIVTRSWKAWLVSLAVVATAGVVLRAEWAATNATFLVVTGLFMFFLNRGSPGRYWKFGVAAYSLPFAMMLVGAIAMQVMPQRAQSSPTQVEAQQREQGLQKQAQRRAEEIRLNSHGSYIDGVAYRAEQYVYRDLPNAAGLATAALSMFLIGFWFVRAGILGELDKHLPLLRRIAGWTLPLGLVMTLAAVWLHAPTFEPGQGRNPAVMAARGLFMWAGLPLSIGYFAGLVCLLHGPAGRFLSFLRYAGQMALTNYIGASVVSTLFFSGYGLGYWGQVSRLGQMGFVLAVFGLQLVFSRWWLSKFRYGPLEWLWRGATYWCVPPLRRTDPLN